MDEMIVYNKNFYPNDIFSRLDFSKIKRQLKLIDNELSDFGNICIIEKEHYTISVNSIGEINVYYDLEYENKVYGIVEEIEKLFKSQVGKFSISTYRN
ncbi:TPA: hypothetical protein JD074_14990 [Clostridioides difficile]|uniref:Uncharacterized protein n=2 Tax=Clostridioides difficile TaxID=1496 RepID=D5Q3S1_CLODI|nr:hypothetical protein C4E42_02190 [Clostridioides difficile]EFH07470.1 hypothetical protein HMPREF0220_1553 [Clostridioides difficile NAP08]EFH15719.1 hypothetical protein HMPREF0219_1842 [Clostridioides difficile NAP07]AVD38420.1 hypothetical protein C4E26_03245 [Clostridioides difficile]AVD41947.1 hypothetical protein C4E25_03250 [Clostridioides difficile]